MAEKWNYRVVKSGTDTDTFFTIQEVYYGDGDGEKDYSHTLECTPGGVSTDEIKTQLQRMLKSLDKPILDEIPEAGGGEVGDVSDAGVLYYESTDGGMTLQKIDLDEIDDSEPEETETVSNEEWDDQTKEIESTDSTETE